MNRNIFIHRKYSPDFLVLYWNFTEPPCYKTTWPTWYKVKTSPSCSLLLPFSLLSKSQPLLSPSSIERTHIGSVWSPFNGHNLDMRGVSSLGSLAEKEIRTSCTRCDGVTVRLGEFMYQIMESPAITQMTVDGREIWLIVLLGAVQSIMCL